MGKNPNLAKDGSKKKTAVFVSLAKFPEGDAGSKRLINLGLLLKQIGYQVFFIGAGDTPYKDPVSVSGNVFYSVAKRSHPNFFQKILFHLFLPLKTLSFALKTFPNTDFYLLDGDLSTRLNLWILRHHSKRHHSTCICCPTEFYSPSEFPFGGVFSVGYLRNVSFYRHFTKKDGLIISISHFMNDYFLKRKIDSLYVPFVIGNKAPAHVHEPSSGHKRVFLYCGRPEKKDLVGTMIDGLMLFSQEEQCQMEVYFFGFDFSFAQTMAPSLNGYSSESCPPFLHFMGRVERNKLEDYYEKTDFTILLRPARARYAKAGFPTKISESLEHGVPPLTNFTSDLSSFLVGDINCVQVEGENSMAFFEGVKHALFLSEEDIRRLKSQAFKTLQEKLSIDCYANDVDLFLEKHHV